MRILILSDIEAGGEWIATQTLIKKLRKKDKNIKFYLVALQKNKYLLKESLFEKIFLIKQKSYKKPFKYYRELFYQLNEGAKIIGKICREHMFDHVITIDYMLSISYLISQKKLNYIYYFHGIKNGYIIFRDPFNHYMVFKKLLEIFALIISKKIIIPSIQAKTYLFKNYGFFLKKTTFSIVPNLMRRQFTGVRVQKNNEENKIILYSGRLDPNKGIRNLLHAFLRLTKIYHKLSLAIAYFGKPNIKLFNEIKHYINKGEKIRLLKNLEVSELANLYRSSTLGILPSSFEISPLFYKEALACDLPIFITDIGDVERESFNTFLLKDSKTDTISSKITDFLKNENRYKKNAKIISKKWQDNYDENKIIGDFLKAIIK
jgi:glycosyltransferase involved in cell wall biosynthesis